MIRGHPITIENLYDASLYGYAFELPFCAVVNIIYRRQFDEPLSFSSDVFIYRRPYDWTALYKVIRPMKWSIMIVYLSIYLLFILVTLSVPNLSTRNLQVLTFLCFMDSEFCSRLLPIKRFLYSAFINSNIKCTFIAHWHIQLI